MKKFLVLALFVSLFGFSYSAFVVKADTFEEDYIYEEYNYSTLWGLRIDIEDDYPYGSERNYIKGELINSSDTDVFYFVLNEFTWVNAYKIYSGDYNVNLIHEEIVYSEGEFNQEFEIWDMADLNDGVYLPPGSYYFQVEYDGYYTTTNSISYYFRVNTNDEYWSDIEETPNIYDELVDNTKAIMWRNAYQPNNDQCLTSSGWDCTQLPYYDEEYLDSRLYILDRDLGYFVQAVIAAVSEEISDNYEDYETYSSGVNFASTIVTTILGEVPNPYSKAAALATKALALLTNSLILQHQEGDVFRFLGEIYSDEADFLQGYRDYIMEYFSEDFIIDIVISLFNTYSLAEMDDLFRDVSLEMSTALSLMDVDDMVYLDFYETCYAYGYLACNYTNVTVNTVQGSSTSNDGPAETLFQNGQIELSSLINNDYGHFEYFKTDDYDVDDSLRPVIHFLYDEYQDSQNYEISECDANADHIKLIEMNSPTGLDELKYGTTAYDRGLGYIDVSLYSYQGFSAYGIYSATFKATDGVNGTVYASMYYRIYNWAYKYDVYDYELVGDSWVHDGTGTAYFSYSHDGFTVGDNYDSTVFRATSDPEYYYKRKNYEYQDEITFRIYQRDSGFLGIPTDDYIDEIDYYIDEIPSTSDNADYFDYKYYYINSLSTSLTQKYIGNYFYFTTDSGSQIKVYMDPRSSVEDGEYFVKYTDYDYDDCKKLKSTSTIGWQEYQSSYTDGDWYYYYYASYTNYTDGLGYAQYSYLRYPCYFDLYFNIGRYDWVYSHYSYYVTPPADTNDTKYVKDENVRHRVYQ